jgi:phage gp36-like protein
MPIITRAELQRRISSQDVAQLADLDGLETETPGMVDACLADAEAEVMGYVRAATSRSLPDPAPDVLKRLVVDVARYNLYQRHLPEDHPATLAYRSAVAMLRDIAAGRVSLGIEAVAVGSVDVGWAPARVMTDAALAGMGP